MSERLFSADPLLDADFLEAAYGDDVDTAVLMFQQYLDELPTNIKSLEDSYATSDMARFRHLIHKQKPGYSYVGLTNITKMLQDLQIACENCDDLTKHKPEIDEVLVSIKSSSEIISRTLDRLLQYQ